MVALAQLLPLESIAIVPFAEKEGFDFVFGEEMDCMVCRCGHDCCGCRCRRLDCVCMYVCMWQRANMVYLGLYYYGYVFICNILFLICFVFSKYMYVD